MSYLSDLQDAQLRRYQQQISQIRGSLIGTGTGNSLNKPADIASMKYFLAVKTLSAGFIVKELIQGKISENQTKDYYKQIGDFNAQQDSLTRDPLKEKILKYQSDNGIMEIKHGDLTGNDTLPLPGEGVIGHNGKLADYYNNNLGFPTPDGKGGMETTYKSWLLPDGNPDQSSYTSPDNPMTEKLNAMLEEQRKETPGSYKFFIEKLHGKSIDGTFYKKNKIIAGQTRQDIPNRMIFPAYIMNFNDSYALGWNDYKFIGRGEKVYVYEETTRTLALEFYMMSDFSAELLINAVNDFESMKVKPNDNKVDNVITPTERLKEFNRLLPDWGNGTYPDSSFFKGDKAGFVQGRFSGTPEQIWARRTFLAQCCYAYYRKDGKLKEQPFIRVRIGDFFDVIAKIDGLDFTTEDFDMDLNISKVGAQPMGVRVVMRMTIIHEDEPTSEYPHFYHRKDFDENPSADPYELPDNMKEASLTLDSALDRNKPGSPTSFISSLTDHGKSQVKFPNDIKGAQETLKSFGGSVSALQQSAGSMKDMLKAEKIKEALKNALALAEIKMLVELRKVKDIKQAVIDLGTSMKPKNVTSLSNLPITDVFKTVQIPKVNDFPSLSQSLFPSFKKDNTSRLGQ